VTAFEPHAPDHFETADTYDTREVDAGTKVTSRPRHGQDVAQEIEVEREREVGAIWEVAVVHAACC
jgi:hypothetical protein